jgi:hypothetical protein
MPNFGQKRTTCHRKNRPNQINYVQVASHSQEYHLIWINSKSQQQTQKHQNRDHHSQDNQDRRQEALQEAQVEQVAADRYKVKYDYETE